MYLFNLMLVGSSIISLTAASTLSSGQLISINALEKIMNRQVRLCKPVRVASCSASCGAGFEVCVSWPTCYNPTAGEVCCSDGSSCRKGYYCTDAGCCPDGVSKERCGASYTLSVIPPGLPAQTSTTTSRSTTPALSTTTTPITTTTTSRSTTSSRVTSTSTADEPEGSEDSDSDDSSSTVLGGDSNSTTTSSTTTRTTTTSSRAAPVATTTAPVTVPANGAQGSGTSAVPALLLAAIALLIAV